MKEGEVQEIERMIIATRRDLEAELEQVNDEEEANELPDEKWTIMGTLDHIASAEQWYFDRLGLALSTSELPGDPLARLKKVREHTLTNLKTLASRKGVVTLSGETWSARKVMRRTLWHERDHTVHIRTLKQRL